MKTKILKLDDTGRPDKWIDRDTVDLLDDVPRLTNRRLFQRDGYICMYCGDYLYDCERTRDHIVPASTGGKDEWTNVVTACRECHHKKAGLTPDQFEAIGVQLLAIPYAPNRAEQQCLADRRVLTDQMDFLKAHASRRAKLLCNLV